ncbi:heavy-metal-associated domain-containing protein [Flavitalea flava]
MKTIKALSVMAFALTMTFAAKAQRYNDKLDGPFAVTKAFGASGQCEMCKHRIENAINRLPGIWSSNWNVDTKTVLVKYDRSKINVQKIEQVVAAVGHDTHEFRAKDEVFAALPECCHYQRKS